MTGILYIVATPIGHLDDLSPRAIQTLRNVAYIAAEDTRHSRPLLDYFDIKTPCISLHEHNEQQRTDQILDYLAQGLAIALISDAGTPLISDPGYHLVQTVRSQGYKIVPIPGPCALVTALSAAGLPSDRFVFEGFLPAKAGTLRNHLQSLSQEQRTLIFYEAPHRILATVAAMMEVFGPERYVVLARELTKMFETIQGGTLAELQTWITQDHHQQKGEFVILVRGAQTSLEDPKHEQALQILDTLLTELPLSQAVKLAAKISGTKKSWLYETALERQKI